jgi:serine/threonine-protein kinase RsbW
MRLVIPNNPEFLRIVRLVVSGYVARWNVPFDEVENIKVAVSEACNNAIQYAYGEGEENEVELACWGDAKQVHFEVKDGGKGVSAPKKGGIAGDDRGLGFLLINTLMDDVKVTSRPGKGTRVLMSKTLGS